VRERDRKKHRGKAAERDKKENVNDRMKLVQSQVVQKKQEGKYMYMCV
jgi:hypothetical protein